MDQTISATTGTDSQIPKAALPSPSTHSSIKEYYGLKEWVIKYLISKEFMIPVFPIKAGSVFPTSSAPLVVMRFSTQGAILGLDFHGNRKESLAGIF